MSSPSSVSAASLRRRKSRPFGHPAFSAWPSRPATTICSISPHADWNGHTSEIGVSCAGRFTPSGTMNGWRWLRHSAQRADVVFSLLSFGRASCLRVVRSSALGLPPITSFRCARLAVRRSPCELFVFLRQDGEHPGREAGSILWLWERHHHQGARLRHGVQVRQELDLVVVLPQYVQLQ